MLIKRFKNLSQFKPYYKNYAKLIIVLLCVMIIASSMGMVLAYLLSLQLLAITDQVIGEIITATLLILAGVTIHHTCWFLWSMFANQLSNKVALNIKSDIVKNIISTEYKKTKEKNSGYYLERMNDDVDAVSSFLSNVAGTMVDVITNFSFLIIIFILNWQCGLFFAIGVIFLFLIDSLKVKKDLKNLQQVKESTELSNSKFNETIRAVKDIKGLGIEEEILKQNEKINKVLSMQKIKKENTYEFLSRCGTFAQWIIDSVLVFICAFWLFPNGQISVAILLIILNYKSLMYETVGFFSKVKNYYVQGDFQAGRILEVINTCDVDEFGSENIEVENASIEIRNLSYSYSKNKKILNNISLKIKANSCSVFIGASGSGKSTLFGALTKLLKVENNKIFYNDYDINRFNKKSFNKLLCIVNQEPFIFNDTIKNNLLIAKPNASDDEIIAVCKKANIYEEINEMPERFNTILQENGANLSGGQKQRLAIARALLKDTPIILFDEPTSALDKANQEIFFNVLNEIKSKKTILIIAHKLNNYDLFDNVFTIHNGTINN